MVQLAGEDILASDVVVPRYISKSASQSVTSSTTFVNDNDFSFSLTPGTYRIQLILHATGEAAGGGDIKTQWVNTGTITSGGRSIIGPGPTTASVTDSVIRIQGIAFGTSAQYGLTTSTFVITEDLLLTVVATGTVTLQWAQFASSATATTLSSASRCFITLIEAF